MLDATRRELQAIGVGHAGRRLGRRRLLASAPDGARDRSGQPGAHPARHRQAQGAAAGLDGRLLRLHAARVGRRTRERALRTPAADDRACLGHTKHNRGMGRFHGAAEQPSEPNGGSSPPRTTCSSFTATASRLPEQPRVARPAPDETHLRVAALSPPRPTTYATASRGSRSGLPQRDGRSVAWIGGTHRPAEPRCSCQAERRVCPVPPPCVETSGPLGCDRELRKQATAIARRIWAGCSLASEAERRACL